MGVVWDSDDRPEDYERYKIEHPPTLTEIFTYAFVFIAVMVALIVMLFFVGQ